MLRYDKLVSIHTKHRFKLRFLILISTYQLSFHIFCFISTTEIVNVCRDAMKWLVCWLCDRTTGELKKQVSAGVDPFTAKNNNQVYLARTLSLAYVVVSFSLAVVLFQ